MLRHLAKIREIITPPLLTCRMSALGQKQTYAAQNGMSALPPIATSIAFFGMSALGQKRTWPRLFDHLICSIEQTIWNGEAQRFGGREIDHQLERGRLYNW